MSKLISKDDFIKLFDNYDITISDSDYSRFEAYADLLCEWNEKINLTAITDPEGISIKHFFDSVYPFTLFEVKENACPTCAARHEDYIPESFIRQKKAIFVEVTGTEGEEA